jgi:hypothetical protein
MFICGMGKKGGEGEVKGRKEVVEEREGREGVRAIDATKVTVIARNNNHTQTTNECIIRDTTTQLHPAGQ